MKFLIGSDQVYFSFLITFSYLNLEKSLHGHYRGFGVADLGFVTVRRIVRAF
jgi:hypothetical protein